MPKAPEGYGAVCKRSPYRRKPFDPINWKNNDLYEMLGLGDARFEATAEDIRNAYRQAVLVHHPDKQAQRAETDDDSRFKLLQKAFYMLSDPDRRQQFDSVDFDESIPKGAVCSDDFWTVFPPVFQRNARFSTIQPVPQLHPGQTRADVDNFYAFWSNFSSWRRFEYLDEDDVEGGDRAEKRYMEKKNKAARQKRKTDDNARIGRLVELAYKSDPRIKAWKEEDRMKKEELKRAKTAKPAVQDQNKDTNANKNQTKDQTKAPSNDKIKQAMAAANEAKQLKKAIRQVFNDADFYANTPKEMEAVSMRMEQVLLKLNNLELKDFHETVGNGENVLDSLNAFYAQYYGSCIKEADKTLAIQKKESELKNNNNQKEWTREQIDMLISTVKTVPPGVADRWTRITELMQKAYPELSQSDIVTKADDIKHGKTSVQDTQPESNVIGNQKKRDPRVNLNEPTILVREDIPNASIEPSIPLDSAPWTAEEQKQLEQAIKEVPKDVSDRWDQIASKIPTRTKDQVLRRVKELQELAKASKKH